MNNFFMGGYGAGFGSGMLLVLVWSLLWKGLALWHASRKDQPYWFIILLLVNTLGILEIIYLFAVLRLKFNDLFKK